MKTDSDDAQLFVFCVFVFDADPVREGFVPVLLEPKFDILIRNIVFFFCVLVGVSVCVVISYLPDSDSRRPLSDLAVVATERDTCCFRSCGTVDSSSCCCRCGRSCCCVSVVVVIGGGGGDDGSTGNCS